MRLMDTQVASAPCSAALCPGQAAGTGAAPVQQPPASSGPSQHAAFIENFQRHISPRLERLLELLAAEETAQAVACCQVWTYLPVLMEGQQVLKAQQLCVLGDPALQAFHTGCAQEGVAVSQLGPMGKVWESGAVQVVQHAESLATDSHPRNRLPGELSGHIAECMYLPVYDRSGHVSQGVLAVVELLIRHAQADCMVVANAITAVTTVMDGLQLSVCSPQQAAQQQQAAQAAAQAKQQQRASLDLARQHHAGAVGAMGRSYSMRTLC